MKANLAQLAAQGNYRAATAQDMEKVYSRNLAQQQIPVSKLAQKSFSENTNADGLPNDIPEFSEKVQGGGDTINLEVHGEKPLGWDLSILQKREQLDVPKRAENYYAMHSWKCRAGGPTREWYSSESRIENPSSNSPER